MTEQETFSLDWAFLFQWLIATSAGLFVGWLLLPAIALVAGGVGVAILQWLVLYQRIRMAWQWVLVSVAGWLAGLAILFVVVPPGFGLLSGAVLGVATGTAQWLLLRRQVHWSGWWIAVSAIAWAIGLAAGLTVMPRVLLSGVMAGTMTGTVLDLLMHYPKAAEVREGDE